MSHVKLLQNLIIFFKKKVHTHNNNEKNYENKNENIYIDYNY